jgi:fructose-specific phosphotransferase system component IIB
MLLSCRNLQLRWVIVALALLPGCARFHPQPLSPASTAAKLEERSLASPELKTFLENYRQHELADWPLKSWEFEDLTIAALYYHPSLEVARAQWRVALGGNKTAAGRPNPTLNAIPGYDFSATGGVNPWIPGVSLDIPIETAGKRGYRMALAQNLGEAARLNIAAAAWQVRANLRASLIDLAAANRREQLLANQTKLQEQLVKSLEEQFQAGEISTFELSQARITRSKTRLDLAEARRLQADARVSVADAMASRFKRSKMSRSITTSRRALQMPKSSPPPRRADRRCNAAPTSSPGSPNTPPASPPCNSRSPSNIPISISVPAINSTRATISSHSA